MYSPSIYFHYFYPVNISFIPTRSCRIGQGCRKVKAPQAIRTGLAQWQLYNRKVAWQLEILGKGRFTWIVVAGVRIGIKSRARARAWLDRVAQVERSGGQIAKARVNILGAGYMGRIRSQGVAGYVARGIAGGFSVIRRMDHGHFSCR
jgi:hypothetical protein